MIKSAFIAALLVSSAAVAAELDAPHEPAKPGTVIHCDKAGNPISSTATRILDDGSAEIVDTQLSTPPRTIVRTISKTGDEWSVTNAKGEKTLYTWHQHHRRVQVTLPDGKIIRLAYGDVNQISFMDIDGQVVVVDPRARWEGRALVVPAEKDQEQRVLIADPLFISEVQARPAL